MLNMSSWSARLAVVAVILLATSGCAGKGTGATAGSSAVHLDSAAKLYSDAATLAQDSTVIVRGTLGEITGRRVDDGGLGKTATGIPMAFYTFSITTAGAAGKTLPSSITIGWIDTDKVNTTDAAPLRVGMDYVLFLHRVASNEAPGLSGQGAFYVPVGADAGVFKIIDGQAVATDQNLQRVNRAGAASPRENNQMTANPTDLLHLDTGSP